MSVAVNQVREMLAGRKKPEGQILENNHFKGQHINRHFEHVSDILKKTPVSRTCFAKKKKKLSAASK